MLKSDEIIELLRTKFGEAIVDVPSESLQAGAVVQADRLKEICIYLRDAGELQFDYLRSIAAVDYAEEFELVYLLFSLSKRHEFKIKVRVPRSEAKVMTVEDVWPAANWHEREAFDLMGIDFEGHSDMRRLLLPDDWKGHPLRKDYREELEYNGVSTQREYSTGMTELPTAPVMPSSDGENG